MKRIGTTPEGDIILIASPQEYQGIDAFIQKTNANEEELARFFTRNTEQRIEDLIGDWYSLGVN